MNILFSFSSGFHLLLVIWFVNGVFQSMIWTPVVRIFAVHFRDEVRGKALYIMSLSLIFGYLAAWALSGLLTSHFSWRTAFLTSGLVTLAMAVPACLGLKDTGRQAQPKQETEDSAGHRRSVAFLFLHTNLIALLVCCLCNGYVRDSIMNWATVLIMQTQGLDLSSTVGVVLIIPAVNFMGILSSRWIYKKTRQGLYASTLAMLTALTVFCLVLFFTWQSSTFLCIAMLAASSAMAYGVNPLLTSLLPMLFLRFDRVGTVAGQMDAMIYLGSAFSGTFAGYLSDRYGWSAVFFSWLILSAVGVGAVLLAAAMKNGRPVKTVKNSGGSNAPR